jgi:hypothetical protein
MHALLGVLEKHDDASLCAAMQRTRLWLITRNHPAEATGAKPGQRTFAKVVCAVHERTRLSLAIIHSVYVVSEHLPVAHAGRVMQLFSRENPEILRRCRCCASRCRHDQVPLEHTASRLTRVSGLASAPLRIEGD